MRFAAPWPHLSLISVIDIFLVAVIIYELLALIQGTRAAYMLVGVAAVVLAFYFTRLGELTTLNWLISTMLPYACVCTRRGFSVGDTTGTGTTRAQADFQPFNCW